MNQLYVLRIGEIGLKKGNRGLFERILKENIKRKIKPYKGRVTSKARRMYFETDAPTEVVDKALGTTPGLVAFHAARRVDKKDMAALEAAVTEVAREALAAGHGTRFKVETRRSDKSLPLDSYGYSAHFGALLLGEFPELTVDVKKPDWSVHVELRDWGYVFGPGTAGPGGLPVGTGGKGVLLLSGGIDSR